MSSWDNLLQALEANAEHERQQALLPKEQRSECRAYYDESGIRMVQTGPPWHDFDPAWQYINIDPVLWDQVSDDTYRIDSGRLVPVDNQPRRMLKLSKSGKGDLRTVRGYVTLPIEPGEEYPEVDHWQ